MGNLYQILMRATIAPTVFAAAGMASAEPNYSIAGIDFGIDETELVGHKRAGLICLPNGSIRFSQVDLPSPEVLRSMITDSLRRTIDIAPSDTAIFGDNGSRHVIVATVVEMKLSLCQPRWGLGDRSVVKGRSEVSVKWDVYSRASRAIEISLTARGHAEARSASDGMSALIADAVVASAQAFAADPQMAAMEDSDPARIP